jgi:alcohol dehydrogenase YqhD (iron-dependent ADH family)
MKYVYKQDIDRFARFAKNVWHIEEATKEESALKAIEATKNFFAEIGLPVTMNALGAKREDVSYMVTQLEKIGGAGNFVKLSGDDIRTIYESAFE